MRRFGAPPDPTRSYRTRPGAYGVILADDGLLLTFQAGEHLEWQLPGGGVDPGEGVVQALHREIYEETGYRVTVERRLGAYQRYCFMPEYDLWARKVCHIYLCSAARALGPPVEPEHIAAILPMEEALLALDNEGDRYFASRVADGVFGG